MPQRRRQYDEDLFKDSTMTFGEHLEELRTCLFRALVGLAVGFILGLIVGGYVVELIQMPLEKALRAYRKQQTLNWLADLQQEGKLPPGDPNRFEELVKRDQLLAEAAYVDPVELVHELKRIYPQGRFDLPPPPGNPPEQIRHANRNPDDSRPEDEEPPQTLRKQGLMRVFLWRPVEEGVRVTSLNAHEPFVIYIKASLLVGVLVASPWMFYQIWSFVAAGLYPHEKKYVHVFLPISVGLFLAGAATAFLLVMEPVLNFLLKFNSLLGIDPDLRISEWLGFVLVLPLGFGISFQLPLVMLFLERIGIFDVHAYLSKWRLAILVIFVLAMFLTPADPTSMVLMAAPLTVLYFGGILLCKWLPRSRSPFDEWDD